MTTPTVAGAPMMSTRAAQKNALIHILNNILDAQGEKEHPAIMLAMEVDASVPADFMSLTAEDFEDIVLKTEDGVLVKIPLSLKKKILSLQYVYNNRPEKERGADFWMKLDDVSYAEEMVKPVWIETKTATAPTTTAPVIKSTAPAPAAAVIPSATKTTPADDFKKGQRRSVSDYPILRDRKGWTKFNRSLLATATNHDLNNLFDPRYAPGTPEETSLFEVQSKFMFSVYTHILQEPTSLRILRQFSVFGDASYGDSQALYIQLVKSFTQGAAGRTSIKKTENELTTFRYNKSWTKTRVAFLNAFNGLVNDHFELTAAGSHSDQWYIDQVNNAFDEDNLMRTYITTLETQTAAMASFTKTAIPTLTWDAHFANLVEHATVLDDNAARAKRRTHEAVSSHEDRSNGRGGRGGRHGRNGRGGGRGRGGRGSFGRGRGNGRSNNGYVPPDVYEKMSTEEKTALYNQRNRNQQDGQNGSATNGYGEQPTNSDTSTPTAPTTTRTPPGAHLRNMLSTATSRQSNASTTANSITINGVTYQRQVNATFRVTTNCACGESPIGALMDSGANGGLLGNDVRILGIDPVNKIDVTGVGESLIKNLDIAHGVRVPSQRGVSR